MKKTLAAVLAIIVVVLAVLLLRHRVQLRPPKPSATKQQGVRPRAPRLPASFGEGFSVDNDPQGKLRLEGQVLGTDDQPVAGAIVTVSSHPKRTTRSEQDGSFVFEKLVGRSYVLTAQSGDLVGGPVLHELSEKSDPAVIRLRQGVTVEVSVVASDKPVARAKVELRTSNKHEGVTNAAGRVSFRGVDEGSLIIATSAAGYAPNRQLAEVPPNARSPVQFRVQLKSGVAVTGRVIDEMGQAVQGARVLAIETSSILGSLVDEERDGEATDVEGRFSFAALTPGSYWLSAKHEAHGPGSAGPVTVGGEAVKDVEIKLEAGATLGGKVVSKAGQPVAWATVRITTEQAAPFNSGNQRQVTADAGGVFKFKGLTRTKLAVAASADVGASEVVTVDLAATPQREDLVLTLDVLGTIAGIVVDEKGEPVAEAQVAMLPDLLSKDFVRQIQLRGVGGQITDGGGRFTFRGLSEGVYRLRAARTGMTAQLMQMQKGVEARTGEQNVKIVLPRPGGIKGVVQYQDGRPVPAYRVTVAGSSPVPIADPAGKFEIHDLPAATYDVRIRGTGFVGATRSNIAIKPSGMIDLGVITVSRGRAVTGRVLDSKGAPVSGAEVIVGESITGDGQNVVAELGAAMEERFGVLRAQSGADGNYQIMGIGKSEVVAVADHPERGRSLARLVPAGDKDVQLDLTLQSTGSLEGRVLVAGKALAGVLVTVGATGMMKQSFVVSTSEQGTFLVERLPVGAYDVTAMSGSGLDAKMGSTKVTIAAGKRASTSIAIEVGEVTLQVTVRGEGGAKIDSAQVYAFKGQAAPRTAKELGEVFQRLSQAGGTSMALTRGDAAAELKNLAPAAYSICIIPLAGDLNDPTFQQRVQKHVDQLAVHCLPCTVASAPKEQAFTATVPPMAPLPE